MIAKFVIVIFAVIVAAVVPKIRPGSFVGFGMFPVLVARTPSTASFIIGGFRRTKGSTNRRKTGCCYSKENEAHG